MNYNKIKNFFICFILCIKIVYTDQSNWIKTYVYKISSEVNFHQIRLYKNTSGNDSFEKLTQFTRILTQRFPIVNIDLISKSLLKNNNSLGSDQLLNNGPVIYVHDQTIVSLNNKVMNFLNFYEKTYPKYSLPKCIVIYRKGLNVSSDNFIKKLLEYAWSKKFLDISVVEVLTDENQAQIYTFNPFFNQLNKTILSCSLKLFPNKLYDVNRYPIVIPLHHNPPYVTVSKDINGNFQVLDAYKYKFLITVFNHLNFLEVLDESLMNTTVSDYHSLSLKKFSSQELNIDVSPSFAADYYSSLPLLILHDDCIPYVGIIEVKPIMKFNLSSECIFYFFYAPVIFSILKFVIFLFKLKTLNFDTLEVVRLMLGMSLLSFPETTWKKIVLIFVFFITMMFSIDFIASLLDTLVSYDELTFDSIEEIIVSNYRFAMNKVVKNIFLDSEKNYTVKDILKKKFVGQDVYCPDSINMNEVICVLSMFRASNVVKNTIYKGSRVYKIISIKFGCSTPVYVFERASPFISHFKSLFLKMYESGIYYWILKDTEKSDKTRDDRKREEIANELFQINITLLITYGLTASLIAFLFEVMIHKLFLTLRKYIKKYSSNKITKT